MPVDRRLWQEPLTDLLITEIVGREGAHPIRLWIRYLREHCRSGNGSDPAW
jgi:hypothetical protein